jgi:hypothetical protein
MACFLAFAPAWRAKAASSASNQWIFTLVFRLTRRDGSGMDQTEPHRAEGVIASFSWRLETDCSQYLVCGCGNGRAFALSFAFQGVNRTAMLVATALSEHNQLNMLMNRPKQQEWDAANGVEDPHC